MVSIYDSRNLEYKYPFGAVREFEKVHFKIILPKDMACKSAKLNITADRDNNLESINMFWSKDREDICEEWECDYIPNSSDIYWYNFEIDSGSYKKYICKEDSNSNGKVIDHIEKSWQLTVYEKDFDTPEWLNGGIMYQIFPDRFYFSGEVKENIPVDRIISNNWYRTPNWLADLTGEVKNNEYFCGDLEGIRQKLNYLKTLNVSCIYLNPIFEAHSNHRYNTADYGKVDMMLGTEEDFKNLCEDARNLGINIIIDGVFSHTGSDSIYFNKENRYDDKGAYNSKDSAYYDWYKFSNWPEEYASWWGFKTLPETDEENESFNKFINGEEGIAQKWLQKGAKGWRLDVADELPDKFLDNFRAAVKKGSEDAIIFGEVWEDASNKISYGLRRRFLLGKQLDSVMNYPFRNAILNFIKGMNANEVVNDILNILENYPKPVIKNLMNSLGTHDTTRVITELVGDNPKLMSKNARAYFKLSDEKRAMGLKLVKLASAMQYTLPGIPCVYYADEAGLEGYEDPFNRAAYPWGKEESSLLEWYIKLGELRKMKVFKGTDIKFKEVLDHFILFNREFEDMKLTCAFNASEEEIIVNDINENAKLFEGNFNPMERIVKVDPYSCAILIENQ